MPPLHDALTQAIVRMEQAPLDCANDEGTAVGLGPSEFWSLVDAVTSAKHEVGLAAFSVHHDDVELAMRARLPGTRGLTSANDDWLELSRYLSALRVKKSVCRSVDVLAGEALRDEVQRSQAVVDETRRSLGAFAGRFAHTREAVVRDLPLLESLAWTLGIAEVIGMLALVLFLRQLLRDRTKRLDARQK